MKKPVARVIREKPRDLETVRHAIAELRALRERMAKRPGFKPITDKEIRSAINEGRK